MRGRLTLLALLLVAGPAAAGYLQVSVDPARTGASPDLGPRQDEVVLSVRLPGSPVGEPLIIGDHVYVLTNGVEPEGPRDTHGLWRIDTTTAQAALLSPISPDEQVPCGPAPETTDVPGYAVETANCFLSDIASDGRRLFVARSGGVDVYDLDGRRLGTWEHPRFFPEGQHSTCVRGLAMAGSTLYVECLVGADVKEQTGGLRGPDLSTSEDGGMLFVAAVDANALETIWLRVRDAAAETFGETPPAPLDQACSPGDGQPCPTTGAVGHSGPSVLGPAVVTATFDVGPSGGIESRYWAFDPVDGSVLWSRDANSSVDAQEGRRTLFGAPPTGTPEVAYLKIGRELVAANPLRGETLWSLPLGREDPEVGNRGSGLVVLDETLIASSFQSLYSVDLGSQTVSWVATLDPASGGFWTYVPYVVADDLFYGLAATPEPGSPATASVSSTWTRSLRAHDLRTGQLAWEHTFDVEDPPERWIGQPFHLSVGRGLAVVSDIGGNVTILGRTVASPTPVAQAPDRYPDPGRTVTVDLRGSEPGLLGPITRYRADWGDGTQPAWQDEPLLEHAYTDTGLREARFWVGNEAGQTAVYAVTFEIGGTPPPWWGGLVPEDPQLAGFVGGAALLVAAIGLVYLRGVRAGRQAEEALATYREVLKLEIAQDRGSEETLRRLGPLRSHLGISARQHAVLERELKAQDRPGAAFLAPGERFLQRYEVVRLLGAGGGGAAYLCQDHELGREVVLKAIPAPPGSGVERGMIQEARAAGRIQDPHVVTIYDVEHVGDTVYLVLEHVGGGSLAHVLEDGPLDRATFVALAHDLLAGLAALHGAGLVHRDVKPANVLVTQDDRFKLADLGIADPVATRPSSGSIDDTVAGEPMRPSGTARYMSPEQARGATVDPRSDLYSAAATLYEAVTGRPYVPVPADRTDAWVRAQVASAGPFRGDLGPDRDLHAWFERALAPDPQDRFARAGSMLEALDATLDP